MVEVLEQATGKVADQKISSARSLREDSQATISGAVSREAELRQTGASSRVSAQPQLVVSEVVKDHFHAIAKTPEFKSLSVAQQQKYLDVLDSLLRFEDSRSERNRIVADFKTLLSHKVDGQPALLQTDRTGTGKTLLDNLHVLATHQRELLETGLKDKRDLLVRSVVKEILRSDNEVSQGATVTCVPTTANRIIAAHRPAEYARVITELATTGKAQLYYDNPDTGRPEPSATMQMRIPQGSLTEEGLKGRSLSEAMFQDSAMDMVGGFSDGLYTNQIETLYEGLWGKPFARLDSGAEALIRLRESCQQGAPNMVSLKWEAAGQHANHAIEIRAVIKKEDIQIVDGKPVVVIGKEPDVMSIPVTSEMKKALESGPIVIGRNPWGTDYPNPSGIGANTIDSEKAIFWMTSSNFSERLNFAMVMDARPGAKFGVTAGGSWGEGARTQFVTDGGDAGAAPDLSEDIKKLFSRRDDGATFGGRASKSGVVASGGQAYSERRSR